MTYRTWFKRIFDILFSIALIVSLAPLFILLAIAVYLEAGKPIFYVQQRLGKDGIPFNLVKFRSMVNNAENIGPGLRVVQNDARITRSGEFLRRFSLDEIPQLYNVLVGDMSFVGPRPLTLSKYKELIEIWGNRSAVRPGLTGEAQVRGRRRLSWEDRIAADLEYIENVSFRSDFTILLKTPLKLISGEGLYRE